MSREELITRLLSLTADAGQDSYAPPQPEEPPKLRLHDADAIITHIEVNDEHGVGALVRKLFAGHRNILSIRSADYHDGKQDFGDHHFRLAHLNTARDAVFANMLEALGDHTIARVLCIPYFADDVRNAIAIKELFGVPLCTYLMDDQNVCADAIPDSLMRELLAKSALRLAISPELYVAYELKYGYKMWFLPPLVATGLIAGSLKFPPPQSGSGVIVGNIWGGRWLDLLRQIVRDSGVTLRWYSNGNFRWLNCSKEDLVRDSIIPHEGPPLADAQLVEVLRNASFVVVPSGVLDESDDRRFIAQLSLPSRIPYILATSHTPVLVLGDPATGAARFVRQFRIGAVVPYERNAFQNAVNEITTPEVNLAMRKNAFAVAGRFNEIGAAEWIWQSLARGEPIDQRYEDLMPKQRPDLSELILRESRKAEWV